VIVSPVFSVFISEADESTVFGSCFGVAGFVTTFLTAGAGEATATGAGDDGKLGPSFSVTRSIWALAAEVDQPAASNKAAVTQRQNRP
jgi:hypothetical protein